MENEFDLESEDLSRLIREDIEWEYEQMLLERKREAHQYGNAAEPPKNSGI